MKTKWIGLEAYNLKLFLIKNRFFMSGEGLEQNVNKLLALGFREVPKSAFRSGARSYWSAPSESGFLRRVVAAFPEYTVEMLPPEGINPTILVNRSQNFRGNDNAREQSSERTSNTRQPVAETTSGSTHTSPSGDAAVLVDDGARNDTGDQPSANVGESGDGQLSSVAASGSGGLRGSSATASGEVEDAQPASGVSEPAGAGGLEQPSEDSQSGSVSERVGAEPRAVNADERGSGLLLSDDDIERIETAVSRRLELVERLHDDTQKLIESVNGAIEGGDHQRHAELRDAYNALDAQEASFGLETVFFSVDSQEGVFAPVSAMGNESITVGEAREALAGAGYGWLSEHIKPVLSFSQDDSQDEITVDRVKQVIVTQFASEAGLQDSEDAQKADRIELESRVARAGLLVRLVELNRIGEAAPQESATQEQEQEQEQGVLRPVDLERIKAAFETYKSEKGKYLARIESEYSDIQQLAQRVATAIENNNYEQRTELREAYDEIDIRGELLSLDSVFFSGIDSQEGVYAPVLAMGNESITVGEARVILSDAGYSWLSEHIKPSLPFSKDYSHEEVTVERVKWIIAAQLANEAGLQVGEIQQREDELERAASSAKHELLAQLVKFEGMALEQVNSADQAEQEETVSEGAAEVDAADNTADNTADTESQPELDKEALIAEIAAKGGIELFGVTRWVDDYDIDADTLKAVLDNDYDKISLFTIVAHSIYPNFELMNAVARDSGLASYYSANPATVKELSNKAFEALLDSTENQDRDERTGLYSYLVLRGSDKQADFNYVSTLGRMANGHRLNSQEQGGKLQRMAEPYMHLDSRSAQSEELQQTSDPMLSEYKTFDAAYWMAQKDAARLYAEVDRLNSAVRHASGLPYDDDDVKSFEEKHSELNETARELAFENVYFKVADGEGVARVLDALESDQDILLDDARAAFVSAGYEALYDDIASGIATDAGSAVTAISHSELKQRVVSSIERMESAYARENNPSNERDAQFMLDYYASLDLLDSISSDIAQLRSDIQISGDSENEALTQEELLEEQTAEQDQSRLVDLDYIEAAFETYKERVDGYSDSMDALEQTANDILETEDYSQAQEAVDSLDALTSSREEIDLTRAFEDAAGEDGVMTVFNSFGGSVTSFAQARTLFDGTLYSNFFEEAVESHSLIGDSEPISVERLKGMVVNSIADRLPKEDGSYADYQERLESVEAVYNRVVPLINTIKENVALALEEQADLAAGAQTLIDEEEQFLAEHDAQAAEEGLNVSGGEATATDDNEPDAGDDVNVTGAGESEAGESQLDIVSRLKDLGYPVNAAALKPFEGISETYRELLGDTKVVFTNRVLYDGFDQVRTGEQTQTLIMNAPRPLMGSNVFESEFFDGRYYALVDTADELANAQVEANVKLNATLPVYMDTSTLLALSLHSNRYADDYLKLLESGEQSFDDVAGEVIRHKEFTINSFEDAVRSFVNESGLSEDLAAGVDGVDGVEELEEGAVVTPSSAGRSRFGDIVVTEDGSEFVSMNARHDWIEVCPIIEGKAQVSANTAFRFHVNPDTSESYPNRDHRAIYHTGRNYHDEVRAREQSEVDASEQGELDAADEEHNSPVTGGAGAGGGGRGSSGAGSGTATEENESTPSENEQPAFADDEEDELREWAGFSLDDLKDAEKNRHGVPAEDPFVALSRVEGNIEPSSPREHERFRRALLSFTGWGGVYDTFRLDGRQSYVGDRVARSLDMDKAVFHNTVMMNRLESYYTPAEVIESMWKSVQQAGVPADGRYLEPSCGSGHFFVGAPEQVQQAATLVGVDCDPIAVRFARAAAPDARIIENRFENVVLDNNFDAVIGNVPFGSTRISDSRYPESMLIHDYFIKRSLSHLKDGGLMAVITTAGTMDKQDDSIRADIMETADLVAGVRLPSNVFARDNAEVVTDILVFQKRPEGTKPSFDFTTTSMVDVGGGESFRVNNFFVENPHFVLGETVSVSGQFGPQMSVKGELDGIGERIDFALSEQITSPIFDKSDWEKLESPESANVRAWDDDAYAVSADEFESRLIGEISIHDDKLVEVAGIRPEFDEQGVQVGESVLIADYETTKPREAILFDYIPLRDAAVRLTAAQLSGEDASIEAAQKETLALYETFVEKHGSVNTRRNVLAFQSDPRSSEVLALENYDFDTNQVDGLAETLYQKVVGSAERVSIDNAVDAYYACIDRKGVVDFDYMAELSGLDAFEIKKELLGDLVFLNPKTNEIETATSYLSGNVVEKLFEAEQAMQYDSQTYRANVAALERVRPLLLPFEDISINLGASWIPTSDIRKFIANMCNEADVTPREVQVEHDIKTGVWKVDALRSWENNNEIAMRSRFGTEDIKFTKLLEMSLNGRKPSHYMTVTDSDGNKRQVLREEATMNSRSKQEEIQEAFYEWVSNDEDRKERFTQTYNDKMNVITPPQADGSRITFPGMSAAWKPRAHQSDVVAMGLMGNNIMAAHPVGAGKTFEMVALAIKLKQVGMATKPMISVPNHMLNQMTREAKEIFPSAKVLMVTNDDLQRDNRKRFFAVARNNDWDLVVCTHSMLDRIKAPFDIQIRGVEEEIDLARRQLDMANTPREKRSLTTKVNTLTSKRDKMIADYDNELKDPSLASIRVDDIGFDTLLVDEAHLYKNLFLNTSMQVLGISQSGSNRATNLLEISEYLRDIHGKSTGLHFFTGTPIANSMAELYVHNRFLRPDLLESVGINTFDQWAKSFGKTVDRAEILADGSSVGIRTRFSEFQNLPELIKMFRTFADVRTLEELNLPTPELTSHTVVIEQTELGKDHMVHLGIRAVATRKQGKAEKGMDNILNIATDGRKAALDLQMIDRRIPDGASRKIETVAQNIMKEWEATHEQKGAQLVFLDLGTPKSDETQWSAYDKLKSILMESGMPKEQIAFIHDAKNDTQKEAIFRAVRNGDVRVLIGSTLKMGVGTNVQERLCALHNVDCPWRPDQLEQRLGRIMRQGNLHFDEVSEYRYVTKDSIELFMYQKLETKDRFIKQAMTAPALADRVMSEEVDAGYGDIMAAATGEPDIKRKFETDAEVERLERRRRSWVRERAHYRDGIGKMTRDIARLKSNIEAYKDVVKALPSDSTYKAITVRGSVHEIQDGDTTWLSATEAGRALVRRRDSVSAKISRTNENSQPLDACIGDLELKVERNSLRQDIVFADLNDRSVPEFAVSDYTNPQAMGRAVRALYDADKVIEKFEGEIKVIEDSIARSPQVSDEWADQEAYDELLVEKAELDAWFAEQDFDSRFDGIADPFEAKLEVIIADHEAQIQMDDEKDMELFGGNEAAESDALELELELELGEDDTGFEGELDSGGQEPRVASRPMGM